MHITLIAPTWSSPLVHGSRQLRAAFPPLALPHIAALTPPEHRVSLVDQSVQTIEYDAPTDLVGITMMTAAAPAGYRIADRFRARGVPVVVGGMHPSALPEEAKEHADAVVIGEAEGVWEQVLADRRDGGLKPFYRASEPANLDQLPVPRRDLLDRGRYLTTNLVQTSRGCPFGCDFCTVSNFFGRAYRCRPVEQVVQEVTQLSGRTVIFVDDNIMARPPRARELFSRLRGLGKRWLSQASLTMLQDQELISLAARSGCRGLFVGFESLSSDTLKKHGKSFNVTATYGDAIKRLHDNGIGVIGAFIFGFDEDDTSVFERTLRFVEKNRIDVIQSSILTPLPGTGVYRKLEAEGRIVDRDWSHYTGGYAVFRPALMSVDQLQDGYDWLLKQTYSLRSIGRRLWMAGSRLLTFGAINLAFRNRLAEYFRRARPQLGSTPTETPPGA